jgi:putative Ca2+/H+ antiporter (TMEM165/GDT1 family)
LFTDALLLSFGVIFVAELGDKSQLMALAFATRYRALPVLAGITAATALVHLVSVVVGALLGAALPARPVNLLAGLAFLGFAVWTLRGDSLRQDEADRARRSTGSAVLAASIAFFLAELGDKTMLATITLATREGLLGTWIGSTLGMVAADAIAILAGNQLGRRLPDRAVRIAAAASFIAFGALLLVEAART